MSTSMDLVGKTISGVVASPGSGNGAHRIWMLQFTDGTHVEFVSPAARRALDRVTRSGAGPAGHVAPDPQLALNVA